MVLLGVAVHLEFVGTARGGQTAQVDISLLLDEVSLQLLHRRDVTVAGSVGVPTAWIPVTMAVEEAYGVGEVVVVIHDVGQIGDGFSTFVGWSMERSRGVVHCIYVACPSVGWEHSLSTIFVLLACCTNGTKGIRRTREVLPLPMRYPRKCAWP